MNNIQLNQLSTCGSIKIEPKMSETTTITSQPKIEVQPYENFNIVDNNDSKFYSTRSLKVERMVIKFR